MLRSPGSEYSVRAAIRRVMGRAARRECDLLQPDAHAPPAQMVGGIHAVVSGLGRQSQVDDSYYSAPPTLYPPAFGALRFVPFVMEPQTAPNQKLWFRGGAINVLCIEQMFSGRKNHHVCSCGLSLVCRDDTRSSATVIGECTTTEHRRELAELERVPQRPLGLDDSVCFKTNLVILRCSARVHDSTTCSYCQAATSQPPCLPSKRWHTHFR